MNPFPASLQEALEARATGAVLHAGGTDLLVGSHSPATSGASGVSSQMLFLHGVDELHRIAEDRGRLIVGAMTTMAEAASESLLPEVLRRACACVGSPALRNMATIGGNLCTASPAGDAVCALYALDAELTLSSVRGERCLSVEDFILGPGRTALADDEILTAVSIPARHPGVWLHRKVASRAVNVLAKVSLAACLDIEEGRIAAPRLALGAVGPTVVRCLELEQAVTGLAPAEVVARARELGEMAGRAINPIDDIRSDAEYRLAVAENLVTHFFETVVA